MIGFTKTRESEMNVNVDHASYQHFVKDNELPNYCMINSSKI